MFKKSLSMILSMMIVFCTSFMLPLSVNAHDIELVEARNNIDIATISGTNGYTQDSAVAYAKSLVGTKWDVDNGSYDCVDIAKIYFKTVGGMNYYAQGNAGAYATTANLPSGWERRYVSNGYSPQPGDVAVWGFGAYMWNYQCQWGHIGILVEVNGNSITLVDQDTTTQRAANYSSYRLSDVTCYIHPDFSKPIPSATFNEWNNDRYTFVSSTNASIGQDITTSGGDFTQVGMILYNSAGTRLGSASDTPTAGQSKYYYNINEELHCALSPNTTYKYQFFAVVGGQTLYSNMKSFTTSDVLFNDWWNDKYTYIGTTDASIGQEIIASGNNYTENGMILYNAVGDELARVSQAPTAGYNRYYFKINEELHYTLTPGTTYKYRFFAVVNGKIYYSDYKSFGTVQAEKTTMSWENSYSLPSKNNACLFTKASAPQSGTFSSASFKIWDKNGSLVTSKVENSFAHTNRTLDVWYDVYKETGTLLNPSSSYTYQMSVSFNGHSYDSPVYTFYTEGENDRHFGIDVSSHQDLIDWNQAVDYVDFAIIRCGYGSDYTVNDDQYWEHNVSECERLNIPYGVYLYSYAENDAEALSEAEHVLRQLKNHHPSLPVYYDLEDNNTVGKLSVSQIDNQAKIFCDKMKSAGYEAGVYANLSWWNNKLTSGLYNNYHKWVAAYGNYNLVSWEVWQYTSSGSIPGISGSVDLNYSRESVQIKADPLTIKLNKDDISLTNGKTFQLKATVTPGTADQTVTWRSNKTSVASVDKNGKVKAVGVGTAIIYAETVNGLTAPCIVTVKVASVVIRGDTDGDNVVSIFDATAIQRHLASLPTKGGYVAAAADADGDGEVTVIDATCIQRFLVDLPTEAKGIGNPI